MEGEIRNYDAYIVQIFILHVHSYFLYISAKECQFFVSFIVDIGNKPEIYEYVVHVGTKNEKITESNELGMRAFHTGVRNNAFLESSFEIKIYRFNSVYQ